MFSTIAAVLGAAWLVLRLAVIVGIPVAVVTRLVIAVARFTALPHAAKRLYPAMLWHRWCWRWLCANLQLSYLDRHRRGLALPGSGKVVMTGPSGRERGWVRFPSCRMRVDRYGFIARVRAVPGADREAFEECATHIANRWRCVRVQVHQAKPGILLVRGLRHDPLTRHYPASEAPEGIFTRTGAAPSPLQLYIGLDEWGEHRWLHLPGTTGVTVGGLPGFGKSQLLNSWIAQLAGFPVAFNIIDGKSGGPGIGDYADWEGRLWLHTGDDLADAVSKLEAAHSLMRERFGIVRDVTGHKNAWHQGPTPGFPLVVTIVDECATFYDLDAVRGSTKEAKEQDRLVRRARFLSAELVRKGRSVLMLTVFITQRQMYDAIPTAIRDNCSFGLSFATRTRDAAVAALGEHIRDHLSYCPTTLQDRIAYTGVATAALPTGQDPFVRIRVPELTEAAVLERAKATASLRTAYPLAPAPSRELVLVS